MGSCRRDPPPHRASRATTQKARTTAAAAVAARARRAAPRRAAPRRPPLPSGRVGVVARGRGACAFADADGGNERRVALAPGTIFVIPTDAPHAFEVRGW